MGKETMVFWKLRRKQMEEVKIPKIEWILKECPFCGNEANLHDTGVGVYFVSCKRCGAATMPKDTEEEAAAAWDERIEYKSLDMDRTVKAIQQKYNEAKENECIKDPLGYALYHAWQDREREKVK